MSHTHTQALNLTCPLSSSHTHTHVCNVSHRPRRLESFEHSSPGGRLESHHLDELSRESSGAASTLSLSPLKTLFLSFWFAVNSCHRYKQCEGGREREREKERDRVRQHFQTQETKRERAQWSFRTCPSLACLFLPGLFLRSQPLSLSLSPNSLCLCLLFKIGAGTDILAPIH